MNPLLEALCNLLFPVPPGCKLCGSSAEEDICSACRQELTNWANRPKCRICGRPLQAITLRAGLCTECHRIKPSFTQALAVGPYESHLREAIHLLKYQGRKSLAPVLGKLLLETLRQHPLDCHLVLPVPLARGRLRDRGFNQAELLAKEVARGLGIPFSARILSKPLETPHQTGLTRGERRKNLQGAFKVSAPQQIQGRNLLIVDDVFTTGSTATEVTQTLLSQGAGQIYIITLANSSK